MSRLVIALHQLDGGGVSRVTADVAAGLAAAGHQVTLALARPGGRLAPPDGVDVVLLEGPSLPGGLGLLARAPSLAALAIRARADWLIAPGNRMHLAALRAARLARAKGSNVRLALKYTNPVERQRPGLVPNPLRRRAFRRAASRADLMLFLSDPALDAARRLLPPGAAVRLETVLNPYVPDRLLGSTPARTPSDPPLLVTVGRLVPQKDQAMMIEALSGLRARPWTLAMLGDGPLRKKLVARVRELGLADRIQLPGYADPAPYLERASLFLLSSAYEELPAVLFEAAAAGVPIVATRASQAIADLFADHASLTAPHDVEAFRAAVAQALDRPAAGIDARALLERHSLSSGIGSHARALGLA